MFHCIMTIMGVKQVKLTKIKQPIIYELFYVGYNNFMAGDEGFEPPITGPEPVALPLGQSPRQLTLYSHRRINARKIPSPIRTRGVGGVV